MTLSFKLPDNLEGNRFIFKFTADHVDLSKIKFFGRVKGAPQQDGTDSPDAGGDNQSETDEQNQPFVSDLIKPTKWIVKATTCWGLETTDDKHYHYSSDSCGQPEHVGLGQDANRSYHYSRFHKTNMHFLIISCLLLVLGFLHLTILENNHTRPCCLKVCDNCYECAQLLICPIVTGFVTIWNIVAFGTALMYRGNDRYGFIEIEEREHSLWTGIDVVSARVEACFDDALASFDSNQIKEDFVNNREV